MKTTDKKKRAAQEWATAYQKVVKEISLRESPDEKSVKDAFSEKFRHVLKGKDLIIENSCKRY